MSSHWCGLESQYAHARPHAAHYRPEQHMQGDTGREEGRWLSRPCFISPCLLKLNCLHYLFATSEPLPCALPFTQEIISMEDGQKGKNSGMVIAEKSAHVKFLSPHFPPAACRVCFISAAVVKSKYLLQKTFNKIIEALCKHKATQRSFQVFSQKSSSNIFDSPLAESIQTQHTHTHTHTQTKGSVQAHISRELIRTCNWFEPVFLC